MEIPISESVLVLAGTVLAWTQAIKKLLERVPWLLKLLNIEEIGGWISIGLAAVIAGVTGFQFYAADGVIVWEEIIEIIKALGIAIGGFELIKKMGGK